MSVPTPFSVYGDFSVLNVMYFKSDNPSDFRTLLATTAVGLSQTLNGTAERKEIRNNLTPVER